MATLCAGALMEVVLLNINVLAEYQSRLDLWLER